MQCRSRTSVFERMFRRPGFVTAAVLVLASGCVSDKVTHEGLTGEFQRQSANKGPQVRLDTEGTDEMNPLGLITPDPSSSVGDLDATINPETGRRVYNLTIEDAVMRTLANSADIRIVSFDPEIAQEEITQQVAEFDLTAFSQLDFENQDNPVNSIFDSGKADNRSAQTGIRQKTPVGSEWSVSFALTRSWDDLTTRSLPTRHEPVLAFQVRQPLLRDAWSTVNLAGVNLSKLNHEISLEGFRKRTEDVTAETVATYWAVYQARKNRDIQKELFDRTGETLERLLNRRDIDVTSVQIKQAEASLKAREAALLQSEKVVFDIQDALLRLMADPQLNLIEDLEIVASTSPNLEPTIYSTDQMMAVAMLNSPLIREKRIALDVADINMDVAKHQQMPRLDLFGTATTQSLARRRDDAFSDFGTGEHFTWTAGLSFEYPLGNRSREAEHRRRKLERAQAVADMQNMADNVANGIKEAVRSTVTDFQEIEVQELAVAAAKIHMSTLEDAETIRQRLTPEFLLVKLQAQNDLALAQRAHVAAIANYNVALVRLAQAAGTVLQLHQMQQALSAITATAAD